MKTTRIFVISTVHPSTDPRIVYKIIPALSEHYEVICALPACNQFPEGVVSIRLPLQSRILPRVLLSFPILIFQFLTKRPKIVHFLVPELLPLAFLFHLLGAKVIYEIQENHYKKFALKRYNNAWIFQLLFKLSDRLARRYFNLILTEDAYLQEYNDLQHIHAVIHNYPSLPFIDNCKKVSNKINSSIPTFFYCGVISFDRCFDILVEALHRLKVGGYEFKVLLFGPVRFSENEVNQLPNYGTVLPHLQFFGYTDLQKALTYTSSSLAGIALLKPVGDYMDSYTTKLFEYMAIGLPVVTSDFPLYKTIVDPADCGFCISPTNSIELSEKLIWFIQNPREAAAMGQRGRKSVETHYNWETEKIKLLNFYEVVNN